MLSFNRSTIKIDPAKTLRAQIVFNNETPKFGSHQQLDADYVVRITGQVQKSFVQTEFNPELMQLNLILFHMSAILLTLLHYQPVRESG